MEKFKELFVRVNGSVIIEANDASDISIDQYSDYIDFKYKIIVGNASITKEISVDLENAESITIMLK